MQVTQLDDNETDTPPWEKEENRVQQQLCNDEAPVESTKIGPLGMTPLQLNPVLIPQKHDQVEEESKSRSMAEPPYTSPKNVKTRSSEEEDEFLQTLVTLQPDKFPQEQEGAKAGTSNDGLACGNQKKNKHQDADHEERKFKEEPQLINEEIDPDLKRRLMQNYGGSAKPMRVQRGDLFEAAKLQRIAKLEKTVAIHPRALDEELYYIEQQKSAQGLVDTAKSPLFQNRSNTLFQDFRSKQSEGTATARRPFREMRSGIETQRDRIVNATCRYSSWERNQQVDQSIEDSLTRILDETLGSVVGEEAAQKDEDVTAGPARTIKQARGLVSELKTLALSSCSTEHSSMIEELGKQIDEALDGLEQSAEDKAEMEVEHLKESIKAKLRQSNVGVAIKNFQTQGNLQAEIECLLQSVEELQDNGSKMSKKFKHRLGKYEKELIEMQNIISDFQRQGNSRFQTDKMKNQKAGTFTGYNGMKMLPGGRNDQSGNGSFISAYGSQGPYLRENSQIYPPQNGFASILTNSKLNRVTQTPNNNQSVGVVHHPWKDENGMGRVNGSGNIYIADHNSTGNVSGLLYQGNPPSAEKAQDQSNPMNTAMIASMTQRSHLDNEIQSTYNCSHRKQPLTARCGSQQPRFTQEALNPYVNLTAGLLSTSPAHKNQAQSYAKLLDLLQGKLRSLTERIREVILTKFKDKPSMKSQLLVSSAKSNNRRNSHSKSRRRQRDRPKSKLRRGKNRPGKSVGTEQKAQQRTHRSRAVCRDNRKTSRSPNASSFSMTNLTSQSPKGSAGVNPFNKGFIKSTQRGMAGGHYGQQLNDGWNTIRTGSYTIGNDKNQTYQTYDEMQNVRKMNPSGVRNFMKDEEAMRIIGFSTSRQDCDTQGKSLPRAGKIHIRKKSDRLAVQEPSTAPAVMEQREDSGSVGIAKMITGECSVDAVVCLRDMHQKQDQIEAKALEESKRCLAFQEPSAHQQRFFKSNVNLHQLHEIGEQVHNNDQISERRQEFSATFNNQLSSVKKEISSSGNNKSAEKFNFYPSSFPEQIGPEEAQGPFEFSHSRQGSSRLAVEEAPRIPKLNLGVLQKEQRQEYFTKNISSNIDDCDDTSFGELDEASRNQIYQSRGLSAQVGLQPNDTGESGSLVGRNYVIPALDIQMFNQPALAARDYRGDYVPILTNSSQVAAEEANASKPVSSAQNQSSVPSAAQLQVQNQASVVSSVLTSFNNNLTTRRNKDNGTHSPRPYMSFIDSDKFSPIQSVSDEDISDPSLEVQQAKQAFDGEEIQHVFDQNLSENRIIDESIQKIVDTQHLFTKASEVPDINYYDFAVSFEKLIDEIDGREGRQSRESSQAKNYEKAPLQSRNQQTTKTVPSAKQMSLPQLKTNSQPTLKTPKATQASPGKSKKPANRKTSKATTNNQLSQPDLQNQVPKHAKKQKKGEQSPKTKRENSPKKKSGPTNSATNFAPSESGNGNNFTLGATNINVFALSPQAFSSSMISSLSKELLSNLSSAKKKGFNLLSIQGPVPPQLESAAQNAISKKNQEVTLQTMQNPKKMKQASKKKLSSCNNMRSSGEKSSKKQLVLDQQLPRNISSRFINENILVLPLQIQKREQMKRNESQNSKKSLLLQDTFPEALITLNKELLEKRLPPSYNSGSLSNRGNYTTRESLKNLCAQEGIALQQDSKTPRDFRPVKYNSLMPPKAPQTTRNSAAQKIQFNFRPPVVKREPNKVRQNEDLNEDQESKEVSQASKGRKRNRNHLRQQLAIIPSYIHAGNSTQQVEQMPYSQTATHQTQPSSAHRIFRDYASSNPSDTSVPAQSRQAPHRSNPLAATITPTSDQHLTSEPENTYVVSSSEMLPREPGSAQPIQISRAKVTEFMQKLAKQSSKASRRQQKSPLSQTTSNLHERNLQLKTIDYAQQDENAVPPENGVQLSQTISTKARTGLKPLKQLAFKRRRAGHETIQQPEETSYKHSPAQRATQRQPDLKSIASSSPLRSAILQRQSELSVLARSCITLNTSQVSSSLQTPANITAPQHVDLMSPASTHQTNSTPQASFKKPGKSQEHRHLRRTKLNQFAQPPSATQVLHTPKSHATTFQQNTSKGGSYVHSSTPKGSHSNVRNSGRVFKAQHDQGGRNQSNSQYRP